MKKLYKCISLLLLPFMLLACAKEGEDIAPGISLEQTTIETYAGGQVYIEGTASNYVGLKTITLKVDSWNLEKVFDLSSHTPVVFNFTWDFNVPTTAADGFKEQLLVEVEDVNGKISTKTAQLIWVADTQAPSITLGWNSVYLVDWDTEATSVDYDLQLTLKDDRCLDRIVVKMEGISLEDSVSFTTAQSTYTKAITFTAMGTYNITAKLYDKSGNVADYSAQFIVVPPEPQEAVEDYDQMYIAIIDVDGVATDETKYIAGYYNYCQHQYVEGSDTDLEPYCYYTTMYAPGDNTHIVFVPTESLTGAYYGTSHYLDTKLINSPGYAYPITIAKRGYYYVWMNLSTQEYTITPIDDASIAEAYSGDLWVYGTGWTGVDDWAFPTTKMTQDADLPTLYTFKSYVEVGTVNMSFAVNDGNWNMFWKGDGKYWWFQDNGNGNNFTFTIATKQRVLVTFSPVSLWATIETIE